MNKRTIHSKKPQKSFQLPGKEEFAPDFSTYGEKREALKELYRQSEKQKEK